MGMPGFVVDFLSTFSPTDEGGMPLAMLFPPQRRSSTSADKSLGLRLDTTTNVLTIS